MIKQKIINAIKIAVENFVKDNFNNAKFGNEAWKKRTSKDKSDRRNKEQARALLTKTSRLRRSIRAESTLQGSIYVKSDVPYAKIHNEGGEVNHPGGTPYVAFGDKFTKRKQKGRIKSFGDKQMFFLKKDGDYPGNVKFTKPHKIKIPKRQYIGKSPVLMNEIEKDIKYILQSSIKKMIKKK